MELLFKNKPSVLDVMTRASKCGCFPKYLLNRSLLIQSENFKALSRLYNTKGNFVDLIYIDPPFSTNQTFLVSDARANTVSRSKAGGIAYADLMEDDAFLCFMYERFILLHKLLTEQGSLYVHINTKMGHYFKIMLDEIFGPHCFKNEITRIKSNPKNFDRKAYGNESDMILFYAKSPSSTIWNEIKIPLEEAEIQKRFTKTDADGRKYTTIPLHAPGETTGVTGQPWRGMLPPEGRHWRTSPEEFDKLDALGRIEWSRTGNPRIKKYADEHKGKKPQNIWTFKDPQHPIYPTQKNLDMLKFIVQQSSKEDSVVLDCFSGSGTTLFAAKELNRRYIGIDCSPLAISVSKDRLNLPDDCVVR